MLDTVFVTYKEEYGTHYEGGYDGDDDYDVFFHGYLIMYGTRTMRKSPLSICSRMYASCFIRYRYQTRRRC